MTMNGVVFALSQWRPHSTLISPLEYGDCEAAVHHAEHSGMHLGRPTHRPQVSPTRYKDVCSGMANHTEAVRIEFDPAIVSYAELTFPSSNGPTDPEFFYRTPTSANRQGNDIGTRTYSLASSAYMLLTGCTGRVPLRHPPEQMVTAKRVTEQVHFTAKGKNIVTRDR